MFKKVKSITITILLVVLISIVNTVKGGIIMECGYNFQFWFTEIISLLLWFGLLYYLLKLTNHSNCTTVVNENIKK
jgi:hypothetical protein